MTADDDALRPVRSGYPLYEAGAVRMITDRPGRPLPDSGLVIAPLLVFAILFFAAFIRLTKRRISLTGELAGRL